MIKSKFKKGLAMLLVLLLVTSFITIPAYTEPTMIAINVTSPANKYDGEIRSDCMYLYGNNSYYSWVEYEINVAESGIYQLDAEVAVGANHTAQLQIVVDDVEVEGIFDVAPDSTAWKKRSAMLHDSIPLTAGTRKIRIKQAELVSDTLLYGMKLTKVGEIQNPGVSNAITIDVTLPTNKYDGIVNTNNFQFYGNNSYYSWVEYEINVEESGIYQLDANLAVGANLTAQLQIIVDDVEVEGIFDVAPDSGSYTKRNATLHDSIPLSAGTRRLKIKQAELVSTVQLYSLTLTKVGEIQEPDIDDPDSPVVSDTINIDVTSPADKYDGMANTDNFQLYGNNSNYSWVEYEINVEESGIYQLDANLAVGANLTAQLQIIVDDVEIEGIFDVAPSSISYEKRNAMLHNSILLVAGTRRLKIKQAELLSTVQLFSLTLTKVGEYQEPDVPDNPDDPDNPDNPDVPDNPDDPDNPDNPDVPDEPDIPDIIEPVIIDVTAPIEKFDAEGRTNDFFFYGGNVKNYSWGTFEVEIPEDGMYRPDIQLTAAANAAGGHRLEIDGLMLNDIFEFPADSGSYVLRSFSMEEISLTAGTHTIRIYQTVAEASHTLNSFALIRTGEYKRPKSVTILGSKATSSTVENKSNLGDGYMEWSQVRGGTNMTFDISMPTGLYDVSLLVSASEEYNGFATVSVNGVTTQTEGVIPAGYETDADAKSGTYYEVKVAEGVWLHTGDNTVVISGAKSNADLFYLRGVSLKPAEKNWNVQTSFGDFAADGSIDVNIVASNNSFTDNIQIVLAIAFYDSEGELLELTEKPYGIENGAPVDASFNLTAPIDTAVAKAFVWDGTSIYDSQMMYYTEVIEKMK